MQLWQIHLTASLFLASGRECKIITEMAIPVSASLPPSCYGPPAGFSAATGCRAPVA